MAVKKIIRDIPADDCACFGSHAGEIRHIERKIVAARNKRINRFQADVVSIDVVSSRPA
jgi:hypothetical protein